MTVEVRVDNEAPTSQFNGNGLVLVLPGGSISGSAADNASGIAKVAVTFVNNLTKSSQTSQATLDCDAPRTSCTWTVSAPRLIGSYKATSVATDRAGNQQHPATVTDVHVLA